MKNLQIYCDGTSDVTEYENVIRTYHCLRAWNISEVTYNEIGKFGSLKKGQNSQVAKIS